MSNLTLKLNLTPKVAREKPIFRTLLFPLLRVDQSWSDSRQRSWIIQEMFLFAFSRISIAVPQNLSRWLWLSILNWTFSKLNLNVKSKTTEMIWNGKWFLTFFVNCRFFNSLHICGGFLIQHSLPNNQHCNNQETFAIAWMKFWIFILKNLSNQEFGFNKKFF